MAKGEMKRFFSYYKPYKWWLALDLLVALLASFLSVIVPAIVRKLMNMISSSNFDYKRMIILFSLMLFLYLLESLFVYIRIKWGHYLGVWIENDMRLSLFSHLETLSFSYFDKTKTGTIMSRITNDLFNIAEIAHHGPEDVLISIFTIIGAYTLMFTFSWPLALVSIIPLPVMTVWGVIYNRKLREKNRTIRKKIAELNVETENAIQGIREVKSYSQEEFQEKKFKTSSFTLKKSREDMYQEMASYHAGINFMRQFYYFTTIVGGIVLISLHRVNVSDFVTFILYVSVVLPPIDRLINFTEQFTQGAASFERFTEIMDIKPEIVDKEGAKNLVVKDGEINFSDVTFSYREGDREIVIEDLSVDIPSGKKVAFVGESGAGKSTLVSLLARFYEIKKGRIEIDGEDIKNLTQSSLHKNIGFVQQNVFLFDSSIRENLRYGKPDATESEMWEALKRAHLDAFVSSLPDGLDTEVGERGTRLSGGQKQRLSIARVFLKNPPILVFDEATSSLDTESETYIQEAFNELSKGRTSIVIAHRLSTIIDSDIIYVLDKGKVAEKGTHDELMRKEDGIYRRLYNLK